MAFVLIPAVVAGGVVAGIGAAQVTLLVNGVTDIIDHLNATQRPLYKLSEVNLTIAESFTLLWIEEGEINTGLPLQRSRIACLLAGYFLDLVAHSKISIDRIEKKKKEGALEADKKKPAFSTKVTVRDSTPVGNFLDKLLHKLVAKEKPRSLKKWIFTEHIRSDWIDPVVEDLERKGILEAEHKKSFGVLSKTTYKIKTPETRENLRTKAREVALNNAQGTGNMYALLGLLLETDALYSSLLPRLFSSEEMDHAKNNLHLMIGKKK